MVFVTVGTHEQPFNRLIQKVDELKRDGVIKDDVIIQTGFSTYEPKYCQWSKLIPYQQMVKNVADARIVITHGGARDIIWTTRKKPDFMRPAFCTTWMAIIQACGCCWAT